MFRLVSIITLLFLFITSVKADQNDPRLNNLFEKLNKTENQEQISDIIKDIWDIHFIYYNENNEIFKIEERIDTLHLAEGNIGPRI